MTEKPILEAKQPYTLAFLTEDWVWEESIEGRDAVEAIEMACDALKAVVREEHPEVACVTVLYGDLKLGLWDWVKNQPVWTPVNSSERRFGRVQRMKAIRLRQ